MSRLESPRAPAACGLRGRSSDSGRALRRAAPATRRSRWRRNHGRRASRPRGHCRSRYRRCAQAGRTARPAHAGHWAAAVRANPWRRRRRRCRSWPAFFHPSRRLSKEICEIGPDALEHRDRRVRQRKRLAADRLEDPDIYPRPFEHDVPRNLRDRVLVGIAARDHPAAHEILVEALRTLAGGKAPLIAFEEPIAAAVRRMDLVGEDDATILVEAELVFGIDEDETVLLGDLAAAGEEGESEIADLAPLLGGE